MYIKNNDFKDEDTLFETLYDFEIGEPSIYMQAISADVQTALENNISLKEHAATLPEEERLELYDDWKRENTIAVLLTNFTSFKVFEARLYGISANDEILLYTIDMI